MRRDSDLLLRVLFGCLAVGACSKTNGNADSGTVRDGESEAGNDSSSSDRPLPADTEVPLVDASSDSEGAPRPDLDGAATDYSGGAGMVCPDYAAPLDGGAYCPLCGPTWGTGCPAVPNCGPGPILCTLTNQQAIAVSLGETHSCAVAQGGQVHCWGTNNSGEVGTTTTDFAPSPTPVMALQNVASVSAGNQNTCAVRADGTVWCWGKGVTLGQGGNVPKYSRSPLAVADLAAAVGVSVGDSHACAVSADGTVRCWGDNAYGQLGVGRDIGSSPVPVKVVGLEDAISVSAKGSHTCALRKDGTIACWGSYDPQKPFPLDPHVPAIVPSQSRFVAAAAGPNHHCAVTDQGAVQCWGEIGGGQLGDDTRSATLTPVSVAGVTHAVAVSCGRGYTCALLDDGNAQCWGKAEGGRLGDGTVSPSDHGIAKPTPVSGALHAVAISSGPSSTCALGKDGSIRCWGAVYYIETVGGIMDVGFPTPLCGFGDSTSGSNNDPPAGASDGGVVGDISIDSGAILASGQNHSCAIRPNGTVACWGENSSGQATPPSGTFISLSSGAGIGPDYTCGIRTDHSVACWGRASSPPAEKFAALSGSLRSVCGILTNGAVRCWGDNLYGQTDPPEGPFLAVAGGEDHACGIRSDHTIACWGRNHHGQATPPPGNFTAISAGGDTTCAVRTDGTMSCWGVLGVHPEGTFKAVSVRDESQICGIRTDGSAACWGSLAVPANAGAFSAIALGRGHACGMRTDGKVVCWGDNDYGQATPPGDQYVSVAIGTASCGMGSYLCGIRTDGTIACWGSSPANPPEGSFRVLSAGHGHVCAIRTDQTLVCWPGAGAVPQGRYRAVSVGFAHACALTVEGKPVCWGDSRGTTPDETFTSIAAGYQHTCAMRSDGSVVCWGTIEDIGCPPATPVTSSARSPDGAFTALAIGSHSCGIRPDGAVECWDHGCDEVLFSLRNGCPRRCSRGGGADVPAPSGPLSSVTSNMGSFCGLRPNGAAVCWGYQAVPASSMPQDSFAAIAVGTNWGPFACGIRASDSQLSCWGYIAR